ncbi:MAG: hypothetical protein RBS05_01605 [Zoogloea oleivorans]|jgi:hypothetical protein|uniref:hypothetical protein n=1 Tax=Zoogloea oleivorans TaxID=1552750 RepID=UPI001FE5639B|nr:hypothetical protein [Zoogloea oleivorans]MDY0034586.1 hypothetical protein [Zoogloea oleivorans]
MSCEALADGLFHLRRAIALRVSELGEVNMADSTGIPFGFGPENTIEFHCR